MVGEEQPVLSKLNNLPKRSVLIIAAIVLIVIIVIVSLFLLLGKKKAPGQTNIPEATAVVSITKNGFVPATLVIKAGQTIKWINNDDSPHRVASDPHPTHTGLPGFDSKNDLEKSASFNFNFDKTGTFGYHDHLNPETFKGFISVQ